MSTSSEKRQAIYDMAMEVARSAMENRDWGQATGALHVALDSTAQAESSVEQLLGECLRTVGERLMNSGPALGLRPLGDELCDVAGDLDPQT